MAYAESKTTTVGLVTRDHVILAADKRATAGQMIYHKQVKKIATITNYAAMTISGLVADAQFLIENARYIARDYELNTGRPISIRGLASSISTILSVYLRRFPFIVQLLIGGYDQYEGPSLYYLDLYGTLTKENFMATGSGSPVAFGLLEANYRPDLDLDTAVDMAVRAVLAAQARDGFSGEGVDVVVIGRRGIELERTIQLKKTLLEE